MHIGIDHIAATIAIAVISAVATIVAAAATVVATV